MPNPGKSTLDEVEEYIRAQAAISVPVTQIAKTLGVARSTVDSFMSRKDIPRPGRRRATAQYSDVLMERPLRHVDYPEGDVTPEELLADENRRLKRAAREHRSATVAQERVLLAIEDALGELTLPTLEPLAVPRRSETAKHRQAAILSDWHGGEVVDPAQVGGLNEFNFEILAARVDAVARALLSFKGVRPELNGLDLWLLGDMVSGDIHEELTATNQFPVAEQAVEVGKLLAKLVVQLAPHYPEIHIPAIAGNHARTKKPHASKNVFDSWDWTAYQIAQGITGDLPNVTWEIPRAGSLVREIAGLKFLLFHGDGIRSSMPGVPAGGVTRRTNELRKQYAQQGIHLDGFACGHFHSANMWAGNVFINGSLVGTNEFGLKNFGGGEAPKQLLLTFDERKHRITDVGFITPTAGIPA